MRTIFTRRQIETSVAAVLAAGAAIAGIADREERRVPGPKFLALERVGSFRQPVHVAQPPRSGLLFVVEREGRVRVLKGDRRARRPFLDISEQVKDEGRGQGLLSIAFAPDYEESGRLYVAFTDQRDALRVVEYRRSPDAKLRADPDTARDLLAIDQPTAEDNGGLVAFGPDRHLYVGVGDGGPSGDPEGNAQDTGVLLGKLLRIDPEPGLLAGRLTPRPYSIPPDNPFVGRPGRDEVYAYGLRDPWRFSFDRATGALSIGDVGNDRFEEVDYVSAGRGRGRNFGWAAYEAFAPFQGGVPREETVPPVLAYPHDPGCAVIGGYVVRDPRLTRIAGPEIVGRYLFGDHCSGRIFAFRPRPGRRAKERPLRFRVPELASFGQDSLGRIYLVSERGPVWRLVPRRKPR